MSAEGLVVLIVLLFHAVMIIGTAAHADDHGRSPWLWGAIVFLVGVWGVVIYILIHMFAEDY